MDINFKLVNDALLKVNQIIETDIEHQINKLSVYASKKVKVTCSNGLCYIGFYGYSNLEFFNYIGDAKMVMHLHKVLKNGNRGFHLFSVWNPIKIELVDEEN